MSTLSFGGQTYNINDPLAGSGYIFDNPTSQPSAQVQPWVQNIGQVAAAPPAAPAPNPNPAPSGGSSGGGGGGDGGVPGFDMKYYAGWDPAAAYQDWLATKGSKANNGSGGSVDPYAQLKNEIGSGWDNYINSLNSQLGDLPGQQTGLEGIANSQFTQGKNTLDLQLGQGETALGNEEAKLDKNQAKTLRDLSGNLKNSFMAGNVYLGARGAGDSSAADQYALALTKEGSRQRGDVMSQTADQKLDINQRMTNLKNIFNTEVNNLNEIKNQKILEIGQWFYEAQNKIKQAVASGQLGKNQDIASLSKDILNQGIAEMNRINTQVDAQKTALQNWAMTNSTNIQQLANNMKGVYNFSASLPTAGRIAGTPQYDQAGNLKVATGYRASSDEEKDY